MKKRNIAILGATGSIGTQALDVVRAFPDFLEVSVLTASSNADLLIAQALEFKPAMVVIVHESGFRKVQDALKPAGIKVFAGEEALQEVVQLPRIDIVLNAIVGAAGLKPTVAAIQQRKDIALANKETLVVAGELIMDLVKKHDVSMLPVDSEHAAIFQCLMGEEQNPVEKIYLTASGGPFRGKDRAFLSTVTKSQALKHPNWVMGAKITIDSASLMNKGLEVIEAKWLFDLAAEQIDVIVHPQSIIHSIVQFLDGSMKAQMGLPDMKLPIQHALTYPLRKANDFERFNFLDYPSLTFEQADSQTFRNLNLAYRALQEGGDRPCVLNAANEVAVAAFLADRISFLEMSELIEATLRQQNWIQKPSLSELLAIDQQARLVAQNLIG
ncbi:1-deoxy-D-xylulose-5-phosphate reductoisomerase [Sphingobacterium griseoflavum]|uniref:1-deoxy-D-xylulose 5-phosphate reductoisomerase n=1 Tax=Sphingobacterium griseoflavum TaxID=1474952 RepID=A0ABQ3I225_9SPHI|nr:1-deoxy-D-xylulose-5-phosphate reductoisomerase [Sphingobacterium griseoflavum]GHE48791.1 1-deoxy-D-xylulose 5-phosphate reductoisomerase [Sphingobacterium griseoflavum]